MKYLMKKDLKESTPNDFEELLIQVAEATDYNDHTGSILGETMKYYELKEGYGTEFIITPSELQAAIPEFFKIYKREAGSKKPKINVFVDDNYLFAPRTPDSRSDYFVNILYAILHDGRILEYDTFTSEGKVAPKFNLNLGDGDAVLIIHRGSYVYADLHVGSSFIVKQLPSNNEDLTLPEKVLLLIAYSYASFARLKYWSTPYDFGGYTRIGNTQFKYDFKEFKRELIATFPGKKWSETYLETAKLLQGKGFTKVTSSGAVSLTTQGKNKALELGK